MRVGFIGAGRIGRPMVAALGGDLGALDDVIDVIGMAGKV
jgi:3-hydroxyisobutyrate dehydrogenase-like beta-hydroxyacid dehydrogenase